MTSVLAFEEILINLHLKTVDEFNALGGDNYWEVNYIFTAEVMKLLGLKKSDVALEAASGQQKIAIQLSAANEVNAVVSFEESKPRHDFAKVIIEQYEELQQFNNCLYAPIILKCGSFCDPVMWDGIPQPTVIMLMCNEDQRVKEFAKETFHFASFGFRILSNLEVIPFDKENWDLLNCQTIKIDLDPTKIDFFPHVSTPSPMKLSPRKKLFQSPTKGVQSKISETPEKSLEELKEDSSLMDETEPTFDRVHEWNTTLKNEFVPFYLITRTKNERGVGNNKKENWVLKKDTVRDNLVGFVPILFGTVWRTCDMTVCATMAWNTKVALIEANLGISVLLKCTLHVPRTDLFKIKADCDIVVKRRNDSEGLSEVLQPTTTGIPKDCIDPLGYTFTHLLPQALKDATNMRQEDFVYVPDEGLDNENGCFEICDSNDFSARVSKIRNGETDTIVFRNGTAELLGLQVPNETLQTMTVSAEARDSQALVLRTTPSFYQVIHGTSTILDMAQYFTIPPQERTDVLSLLHYTLDLDDSRASFEGPEPVCESDWSNSFLIPKTEDGLINQYVSMIGKHSFMRLNCHQDGSTTWEYIAKGVKVVMILMNATAADYKFMFENENAELKKELLLPEMRKRMYMRVLEEGEMIIYPGGMPHAMFASSDLLTYGGRILTLYSIPTLRRFVDGSMTQCCRGHGYNTREMQALVYYGLPDILHKLWRLKVNNMVAFMNHGRRICRNLAEMINMCPQLTMLPEENRTEQWDVIRAHLVILQMVHGTDFIQSEGGFFYLEQQRNEMKAVFDKILGSKRYYLVMFNVEGGLPYRRIAYATAQDLDYMVWRDFKEDHVDWERRHFHFEQFYTIHLCRTPVVVLMLKDKELGMFAIKDIPINTILFEWRGRLMSEADLMSMYGTTKPFGNVRLLNMRTRKGGFPFKVYLDANFYGNESLVTKESDTPNCRIEQVFVDHRVILVVVANEVIQDQQEILLPRNPLRQKNPGAQILVNDFIKIAGINFEEIELPGGPQNETSVLNNLVSDEYFDDERPTSSKHVSDFTKGVPDKRKDKENQDHSSLSSDFVDLVGVGAESVEGKDTQAIGSNQQDSTARPNVSASTNDPGFVHPLEHVLPQTFVLSGFLIRRATMINVPNAESAERYYDLSRVSLERREEIRNEPFGRWYEEFEEYRAMNRRLAFLYGEPVENLVCSLCAHVGKFIEQTRHDKFHKFADIRTLRTHFYRRHHHEYKCDVCGEVYGNGRDLKGHDEQMLFYPNTAHLREMRKSGYKPLPPPQGFDQVTPPTIEVFQGPKKGKTKASDKGNEPKDKPEALKFDKTYSSLAKVTRSRSVPAPKKKIDVKKSAPKKRKTSQEPAKTPSPTTSSSDDDNESPKNVLNRKKSKKWTK